MTVMMATTILMDVMIAAMELTEDIDGHGRTVTMAERNELDLSSTRHVSKLASHTTKLTRSSKYGVVATDRDCTTKSGRSQTSYERPTISSKNPRPISVQVLRYRSSYHRSNMQSEETIKCN